jgi:hypothetical protein
MYIPTVAVYSVNFGNYRDELKNGIDFINKDNRIDYFFFTDNKNLKSNKWNIIITDLENTSQYMDKYRNTSKLLKFKTNKLLNNYDVLIYIASKGLSRINFSYNKIISLIKRKKKQFYFIRHPCRNTSKEELLFTTKNKRKNNYIENKENGLKFYNQIKNLKYNSYLPDLFCVIRLNSKLNNNLWSGIYDLLIKNGLKRDQNIIQHALYYFNFESKVTYFEVKDISTN